MQGQEAVETFKLVKSKNLLPVKLENLLPLRFVGEAAIKFYKTKINLLNKLDVAQIQREETLKDAQDAGKLVLEIEARVGALLPSAEECKRTGGIKANKIRSARSVKDVQTEIEGLVKLPTGIDSRDAHVARTISENCLIVLKKRFKRSNYIRSK